MGLLSDSTWADVELLRRQVMGPCSNVVESAQAFARTFASTFSSVVLARMFVVVPFDVLPATEKEIANRMAQGDPRLRPKTRVLSLAGTHGRETDWCDRNRSAAHLAIPLLDRGFVEGVPMVAKLLADLQVDLAALDDGRAIASQKMLGGMNGKFLIEDARTTRDGQGRLVVPSRSFVETYGVRTVFGMGGAYSDGTLAVAVIFADELVPAPVVGRFPSLISNFKIATMRQFAMGRIYS